MIRVGLMFLLIMVHPANGYNEFKQVGPTWQTSDFFRAGSEDVISRLTTSNQTPSYTFHFSSALPGVPNLAYGIKKYRGRDTLSPEMYEIRRIALTATTFKVQIQIYGSTWLYILNVPYIAIDPTFPHHLNSFDNVPINYTNGNLTNITIKSENTTYYSNTVNYTQQAAGRAYTAFDTPLNGNKILLFICRLDIKSTWNGWPVDIKVKAQILTTQLYSFSVEVYQRVQLDSLHFSQIVFNADDVRSSNKYFIVDELWETVGSTGSGNFKPLPEEFVDNFIMGVKDFETSDGSCGFEYVWDFTTINGQFGAKIEDSIALSGRCGFSKMISTIFYMKTWICQSPYIYFNLTSDHCQDGCGDYYYENTIDGVNVCSRCGQGCQDCPDQFICTQCNYQKDKRVMVNGSCQCGDGYFDDGINDACPACTTKLTNCSNCFYNSSYNPNDANSIQYGCTQCHNSYTDISNFICLPYVSCNATQNQFLNQTINQCQPCTFQGCKTCSSLTVCNICDHDNNYFKNISNQECQECELTGCKTCDTLYRCLTCDEGDRYFRNVSSDACEKCRLVRCVTCKTLYACAICDNDKGYYINATSQLCQKCALIGCEKCETLDECKVCNFAAGYFKHSNGSCVNCSVGCLTCETITSSCQTCRIGFTLTNGECICNDGTYFQQRSISCLPCHQTCKSCRGESKYECNSCLDSQNRIAIGDQCICNPYNYIENPDLNNATCVMRDKTACDLGYIYIASLDRCMQRCGDGLVLSLEICDDGNLEDGDGCDKECKVEIDYRCEHTNSTPSICVYIGVHAIIEAETEKDPYSNRLFFDLKVYPWMSLFEVIDWKTGLRLEGADIDVHDAWVKNRRLYIDTTYNEDLSGKKIDIFVDTGASKRLLLFSTFEYWFTVRDYQLPIDPKNNLEPTLFSETTYSGASNAQGICTIAAMLMLALSIGILFVKSALPTLQIILTLQLTFLSLASLKSLHPIMLSITQYSPIKGIRIKQTMFEHLVSPNQPLEYNVQILGYVSSFFGNMNAMFFVQFFMLLICLVLYLSSTGRPQSLETAFRIFQRQLLLVIIFTMLNLVFSLGLMQSTYPFQVCLAIVSSGLLLFQFLHFGQNVRRYCFSDMIFDLRKAPVKEFLGCFFLGKCLISLLLATLRKETKISCSMVLPLQLIMCAILTYLRVYKSKFSNVLTLAAQYALAIFMLLNMGHELNWWPHGEPETGVAFLQFIICLLIVLLTAISFIHTVYQDFFDKSGLQIIDEKSEIDIKQSPEKETKKVSRKEKLMINVEDLENEIDNKFTIPKHTKDSLFQPKRFDFEGLESEIDNKAINHINTQENLLEQRKFDSKDLESDEN